ncbi:hypothetical protein [Roseinatronobacter alkalisoli]|uniref:Uncharacterized protein n=1 Tax=Roseinatronobacter alkalisoli TaxID=3028235 RepID=A0ABT5TA61_9RHOB|nr:hypothetical protein [Roseinatronobacter sp. HJB301]MDD7971996.1 hypothetical protein [Roseinatronobacter sp. HJB301]
MTNMIDERPNVVPEDLMRNSQAEGYLLEVVCIQSGETRHSSRYNTWVVRAV